MSVHDATGSLLARTQVAADGTFVVDISGDLLRQGMTVILSHHHAESGVTQIAEPVGPLTFATPVLVDLVEGVPVRRVDADADGDVDDITLALLTAPEDTVHVTVDGVPVVLVVPEAGSTDVHLLDVAPGRRDVRVRFCDSDGRLGVAVDTRIVVAAGGGSP